MSKTEFEQHRQQVYNKILKDYEKRSSALNETLESLQGLLLEKTDDISEYAHTLDKIKNLVYIMTQSNEILVKVLEILYKYDPELKVTTTRSTRQKSEEEVPSLEQDENNTFSNKSDEYRMVLENIEKSLE